MSTLAYRNEWEADIYTIDGKSVNTLESVLIGSKKYKVTARNVSVSYNDMGHTYSGTSTHYFVTAKVFGIPQVFDLNTLVEKVAITPVKFTVGD